MSMVMASAVSTASAQDDPFSITMIIYSDASVEFFVPSVNGAQEAAELWGVDLDIQYANSDPVMQNNLIETAIANQVDAIATIIQDDDALDESICAAMAAGIPVVAFNVDDSQGAAGNCRMAFMGQNFIATLCLIGSRMIEGHGLGEGDHVLASVEVHEAVYAVQERIVQ
mgnify:CR=1 FL=1